MFQSQQDEGTLNTVLQASLGCSAQDLLALDEGDPQTFHTQSTRGLAYAPTANFRPDSGFTQQPRAPTRDGEEPPRTHLRADNTSHILQLFELKALRAELAELRAKLTQRETDTKSTPQQMTHRASTGQLRQQLNKLAC